MPGYSGPLLGAKIAAAAPREFTEEQMRAGATTQTFLGKGSHGGATQAWLGLGLGLGSGLGLGLGLRLGLR